MAISSASTKEIARLGANIVITKDSNYSSISVKEIIRITVQNGGTVTVEAGNYSSTSLKEFVRIGGGDITISI